MEPDANKQEEIVVQPKNSVWKTVTPFSKYLAMILFILMPFIGGWIGYQYAPEKVVEVEKFVEVERIEVKQDSAGTQLVNDVEGFGRDEIVYRNYEIHPRTILGGIRKEDEKFYSHFEVSMWHEVSNFDEFKFSDVKRFEEDLREHPLELIPYEEYVGIPEGSAYAYVSKLTNGINSFFFKRNVLGIAGEDLIAYYDTGQGNALGLISPKSTAEYIEEIMDTVDVFGAVQKKPSWNIYQNEKYNLQIEFPPEFNFVKKQFETEGRLKNTAQ